MIALQIQLVIRKGGLLERGLILERGLNYFLPWEKGGLIGDGRVNDFLFGKRGLIREVGLI